MSYPPIVSEEFVAGVSDLSYQSRVVANVTVLNGQRLLKGS